MTRTEKMDGATSERSRLKSLLQKIEMGGENEAKPRILFSDYGLEKLGHLSNSLDVLGKGAGGRS